MQFREIMEERGVAISSEVPSQKLLIAGVNNLLKIIHINAVGGGILYQKIEYLGLLDQFFECNQLQHLGRN